MANFNIPVWSPKKDIEEGRLGMKISGQFNQEISKVWQKHHKWYDLDHDIGSKTEFMVYDHGSKTNNFCLV